MSGSEAQVSEAGRTSNLADPEGPGADRSRSGLRKARRAASVSHPRPRLGTTAVALACVPAVVAGLMIRVWVVHTPLMAMTSDEAFTGLETFQILRGRLVVVPDGNSYGAVTEAYLLTPVLSFWTGVWPLRVMALLLSCVAGYVLYRLALPLLGRAGAAVVGLVGWTMSGAVVQMWSRLYMGYTTGFIAEVVALILAGSAVRSAHRLPRTAALAGLAAGFALWSHPMFGSVAALAMIVPSLYRIREFLRWWLPLCAGAVVGVAPWLAHIARHGWPHSPMVAGTYGGRLGGFFTGLIPRVIGMHTASGGWVDPAALTVAATVVVITGFLAGLVLLVRHCGAPALPLLAAGVLAFPTLALLQPLAYVIDARYGLPFVPFIAMGLGAWLRLLSEPVRRSRWLVMTVPTAWVILACLPVLHQQAGWHPVDPDTNARRVVAVLDDHDIKYLAGSYWGTYLEEYLSDGKLSVRPDGTIRLTGQARVVSRANPADVAYAYLGRHRPPPRRPPVTGFAVDKIGDVVLYLPRT